MVFREHGVRASRIAVHFARELNRGRNACTYFTSLDGSNVRPEAEDARPQAVSVRPDAGAVVSLQPGVRRLRKDSIPSAYFEKGTDAGRVF
jgi:hypothetical protein